MKKLFYGFCFAIITVVLSTCFSPWQGNGANLILSWGNSSSSRATGETDFVTPGELSNFVFNVDLIGPGDPVSLQLGKASSVSLTLSPGIWNIKVFGHTVNTPYKYLLGFDQVEIVSGSTVAKEFALYTFNWAGIMDGIDGWTELVTRVTPIAFLGDIRTEIIELGYSFPPGDPNDGNTLTADSTINITRPIILIPFVRLPIETTKHVTIERDPGYPGDLFNVTGEGSITLGMPGMEAFGRTLTIDNRGGGSLINNPGKLVINKGVKIIN